MKKRLLILVLISILIIPSMVNAKTYQAEIFDYSGEDYDDFADVESTIDGGYIAVGSTWSTNIVGTNTNGGEDALIVKYDKNDKIEWQRTLGGDSADFFFGVKVTTDEGYVAVGVTNSTSINGLINNGIRDALIAKYDKNGNLEWQKIYGGASYEQYSDVICTSDGEYIAVGDTHSTDIVGLTNYGQWDAMLVKYDKDGNLVWQQNYGGSYSEYFSGAIEDTDGSYVLVGATSSFDITGITNKDYDDALIVKYDKNGNIEWQQTFGGNGWDAFRNVRLTDDGNYIVVGNTSSNDITGLTSKGLEDGIIVKFDKQGNLIWQQNYNISDRGSALFYDVDIDSKGNFITTGSVGVECVEEDDLETPARLIEPIDVSNTCGSSFFAIVKYDKNGNQEWQGNYGGNGYEELYGITVLENGDYVAAGFSSSTDIVGIESQGADAIILKVKPIYDITEEKSTNGEFKTIQFGKRGMIEVKPSAGRIVDKITVTDSLDNEVTTYKDGDYYYFELYDDVKVRVTFKEASILDIINPETGSGQVIEFIVIICLIIGGVIFFNKKKTIKG